MHGQVIQRRHLRVYRTADQGRDQAMGVSVRLSRNARVYLPFWVAIPVYLVAAAVWVVIGLVWGVCWLIAAGVRSLRRTGPG